MKEIMIPSYWDVNLKETVKNKIGFKKLYDDAIIPKYAHKTDAGLDFFSLKDYTLEQGKNYKIQTGVAWEPSCNYSVFMLLKDRSSKCFDYSIVGGVIDNDYRGEIIICIKTYKNIFIEKETKIAQGIVFSKLNLDVYEITDFVADTVRGDKGFGSTG